MNNNFELDKVACNIIIKVGGNDTKCDNKCCMWCSKFGECGQEEGCGAEQLITLVLDGSFEEPTNYCTQSCGGCIAHDNPHCSIEPMN